MWVFSIKKSFLSFFAASDHLGNTLKQLAISWMLFHPQTFVTAFCDSFGRCPHVVSCLLLVKFLWNLVNILEVKSDWFYSDLLNFVFHYVLNHDCIITVFKSSPVLNLKTVIIYYEFHSCNASHDYIIYCLKFQYSFVQNFWWFL